MGPRDSIVGATVPINYETGEPLTTSQQMHLQAISDAARLLTEAMHNAEGSAPPGHPREDHHWQSRRMAIAATHLETAIMFARKATCET